MKSEVATTTEWTRSIMHYDLKCGTKFLRGTSAKLILGFGQIRWLDREKVIQALGGAITDPDDSQNNTEKAEIDEHWADFDALVLTLLPSTFFEEILKIS